jgi:dTDP-4-dehydrorhamnose 3,5-epimerase-like enzyme
MPAGSIAVEGALPDGVQITALTTQVDDRGDLTEVFRASSYPEWPMVQWNVVNSAANVLRGVHCHRRHHDVITVLRGQASIGMQDVRPWSPTLGAAAVVTLKGASPAMVAIPPGVAHAFYFCEPSTHLYGVSEYWNLDDELGCHWSDPELTIPWPPFDPQLSARDAGAGTFRDLVRELFEPSSR